MKDADSLNDAWKALTGALETDTRVSVDDRTGIAATNAVLDLDGETTIDQDLQVLRVLKAMFADTASFY